MTSSIQHCNLCGARTTLSVPKGDNRTRDVCEACGHVHYQNPLIVVSTVPVWQGRFLLCKRAIEPRYGLWTLPGGFMEQGESLEEAALRETWEEATARVRLQGLCGIYSLVVANQVYVFYRAQLESQEFAAGAESLEVGLFQASEIPWDQLAFRVMGHMLEALIHQEANTVLATGIIR